MRKLIAFLSYIPLVAYAASPEPHSYVKLFQGVVGGLLFYAILLGLIFGSIERTQKRPYLTGILVWIATLVFFIAFVTYYDMAQTSAQLLPTLFKNSVSVFGAIGFVLSLPFSLGFAIGWLIVKVLNKHRLSR